MIKVKDGYAKLIGTTYQGSATQVLLSNGGDLEYSASSKASALVQRNASQYIYATYFNSAISDEALTDIGSVYVRNTSDTFIRRVSKTQFYSILDDKFVTLDTTQSITGAKTFSTSVRFADNASIIQNQNDISNYTTILKWYKNGASRNTYDPSIGQHNTGGDGNGSICILPYPTKTNPWGGTVGLFISKGVLKLDGKSVALAENYYTKTESDERYVNVTGDTMTGPLIVKAAITGTQLISTIATGTSPLKVTSTTVVTNLNSDLLDGLHETSFFRARGSQSIASSIPTTTELSTNNNLCGSWNVEYTGASGHLVQFNAGSGSTRYMQFYSMYSGSLYWRNSTDSTLNTKSWKTIVDSANYTGIVLKIGTATKGSATLPIYLNAGTPTACSTTLGVSITGNAATANRILSHTISDTLANKTTPGYLYHAGGNNSVADKPSGVDAFGVFTMQTASGWYGQILMSSNTSTGLYWRTATTLSGGWKKILDSSNYTAYINPANFVTALGTSGNYLTWTKAGTTNNITVPYATNSNKANYIYYGSISNLNSPSSWTSDGYRLVYDTYSGSASNKPVSQDDANGIITLFKSKHETSNQYVSQLAFPNNTRMYFRYASAGSFSSWYTIAYTSDIKDPANYYWANVKVSASSNSGTSPTFNTCYTSNWFRSTGNTGWYSESYGGGWYMTDSTWIRTYGSKSVYQNTGQIRTDGYLVTNGGLTAGATSPNNGTYKLHVTGASWSSGLIRAGGGFYHNSVNSNSYVLLAGGSYKGLGDFAKGNAGSATKGVYVTGGTVTAMTYSLSSNLNSGTSGKLAYYSSATTVAAYSSSVGSSAQPIYLNAGSLSASSYSFTGTYSNPVIVWCGEIYRSAPGSTYWYSEKKGGCCSISFTTNNAGSNGNLIISIPHCEPYAAFCSTVRIFNGSTAISAGDGTITGRSAGMGDYMTICGVSGTTGNVYIRKFSQQNSDNDSWKNGELGTTTTSEGNKPVARFYLMIVGRYI